MAGAVAVFFQALPAALLAALAGLALLGTIMGGMATAMANPARREAAHRAAGNRLGLQFLGNRFGLLGPGGGPAGTHLFEYKQRKPAV